MNKKGISPLIATVLIIGFTVALAAVIMTWGQSFTKNIQKQTEETSDVQIKCATDVGYSVKTACIDAATVKVTVSSEATKEIDKFKVRLYKSPSEVQTLDITSPLAGFDIKTYTLTPVNPPFAAADVKSVELFPVVTISGKSISCAANIESFGDAEGTTVLDAC